jgi:hypothetical protein
MNWPSFYSHILKRDEAHKSFLGNVTINLSSQVEEILGISGSMLSGSKQSPPGEEIFWNACIFDKKGTEIWFGDLNLTKSVDKLQEVANLVGKIYVTREHPFRWKGLKEGLKYVQFDNDNDQYYRIFERQ